MAIHKSHSARVSALATIISLSFTAPIIWADDDEIPFNEARIFFELNNTDGDLGIHGKIDGNPWKKLEIEDPNERKLLNAKTAGKITPPGFDRIFL